MLLVVMPSTPAQAAALSGCCCKNPTNCCWSQTWVSPLPPYRPGAVPVATSVCVFGFVGRVLRVAAVTARTRAGIATGLIATELVNGSVPVLVAGSSVTAAAEEWLPKTVTPTVIPAVNTTTTTPTIIQTRLDTILHLDSATRDGHWVELYDVARLADCFDLAR